MIISAVEHQAYVTQVSTLGASDPSPDFGDNAPPTVEEACVITPASHLNQAEGQKGILLTDASKFCSSNKVGASEIIQIDTADQHAIDSLKIISPKLFSAISDYRVTHPDAQLWEYSVGTVKSRNNKEFAVLSVGTSAGDENSYFIIFSRDGENVMYKEIKLTDVRKTFNIPRTASVHWSTLSRGANMPLIETGVVLDVRVNTGSQFYEIVFVADALKNSTSLTSIFDQRDALLGSEAMGEPIKDGAYFLYPFTQQADDTSGYGLRTYDSKSGQVHELDRINENGVIVWAGKSGDYAIVIRALGVDQSSVKFSYEVINSQGNIISKHTDSAARPQVNGIQGLLSSKPDDRLRFFSINYGKNTTLAIVKEFASGYTTPPSNENGREGVIEALLILKGQVIRVGSSVVVPEGDVLGASDLRAGTNGTFVSLQFDSRVPTDQYLILNPPRQPKRTVGINLTRVK